MRVLIFVVIAVVAAGAGYFFYSQSQSQLAVLDEGLQFCSEGQHQGIGKNSSVQCGEDSDSKRGNKRLRVWTRGLAQQQH